MLAPLSPLVLHAPMIHNDYRARILKAMYARQEREDAKLARKGKGSRRARGHAGELLTCGCVTEDEEQRDLLTWGRSHGFVFLWTRSERHESQRLRAWASTRGARSGVPDLIALTHPGLAIELKAKCSKHKTSPAQTAEIDRWRRWGWTVLVAHGAADAIEQLKSGGWVEQ